MTVKQDKWWGKKYPKSADMSTPYSVYRDKIDGLIAVQVASVLAAAEQAGEAGAPWRVAELCGGDGSLAEKLLERFGEEIGEYELLERNRDLLKAAKKRIGSGSKFHGRVAPLAVTLSRVDTATMEGQDLIEATSPDLWLASGSVLCGQVGSPAMAEPTLERMALSLKGNPRGKMIITGFTTTFFTPGMLKSAGLKVAQASLRSGDEADGLVTDSGRFHMWVLEVQSEGERDGEVKLLREEEAVSDNEGGRRWRKGGEAKAVDGGGDGAEEEEEEKEEKENENTTAAVSPSIKTT